MPLMTHQAWSLFFFSERQKKLRIYSRGAMVGFAPHQVDCCALGLMIRQCLGKCFVDRKIAAKYKNSDLVSRNFNFRELHEIGTDQIGVFLHRILCVTHTYTHTHTNRDHAYMYTSCLVWSVAKTKKITAFDQSIPAYLNRSTC